MNGNAGDKSFPPNEHRVSRIGYVNLGGDDDVAGSTDVSSSSNSGRKALPLKTFLSPWLLLLTS